MVHFFATEKAAQEGILDWKKTIRQDWRDFKETRTVFPTHIELDVWVSGPFARLGDSQDRGTASAYFKAVIDDVIQC